MIGIDHTGKEYPLVLQDFHEWRKPATYLEIGTLEGNTLQFATCATIAVDPNFQIREAARICNKPECHLFRQTSDDFFAGRDPAAILGAPIEMAFLDGMHHCEFLLRDFMNTEKYCRSDSVIFLHDCLPVEIGMAMRDADKAHVSAPHHAGWWTGDVWRTALALKRIRPELRISAFDAPGTGLIAVTNLDPGSKTLARGYDAIVGWMMTWALDLDPLFAELGVESTDAIGTAEMMLRRFPKYEPTDSERENAT
jgi:hypothetical protein